MDAVAKVIEVLNDPAVPLWLKLLVCVAVLVAATVWLIKPPHWADAERLNERSPKRLARPPD